MSSNPLLVPVDTLIDYASIEPDHVRKAIPTLIDAARAAIEQAADPGLQATWEDVIDPMQDASERLWRAWAAAGHLNAVVNTPELRAAYNECLPLITEYSTWVGLHDGLYRQYKRLRHEDGFNRLTPVRQRIIKLALRDFRLSGAELEGDDRERYRKISDQQAAASQKFSENVLDTVDSWACHIDDEARLAGLPADVIEAARQAADAENRQGWKLTLKMPCYLPVMQYAHDRALRQELYRAYATIASDQADDLQFDNTPLIEQLLALRAEESALLGYGNFAELRLETRMADSPGQVLDFLRELAQKARPYAEKDLDELRQFARQELALDDLQPWDVAYAAEHLRQERYAYSEEEIRPYFTAPQVLNGLFHVAGRLFGIHFQKAELSTWHPDVEAFAVMDGDNRLRGHVYIDLYARQGKQGGAWVGSERDRRLRGNALRTPVVYLTCNFTPPQPGRPALLTHDDVITLFHESGHALHALLSSIDDPGASAFSAVEWDAIELPSQFMENFCWEWSVVQAMSRHVDTGEPLPRTLYDRLVAARNFQSGMQMVRQLEFALFDMFIHQHQQGLAINEVLNILNDVRREVAVIIPPVWHRFPHNFSHLFAGGYAAGYYSYKWAEVLSADAYGAFEESAQAGAEGSRDVLDAATGERFLKEILAVGGARPAAESFQAFRGREPTIDALLRHNGMTA